MPGVLSLVPDYAQASRLAIEHLYQLGHRHIGIVSGPFGATDPQFLELNRGVRLACEELGLPIEAQIIVYGDLSEKAGRAALEELFAHEARAHRDLLPQRRGRRRSACRRRTRGASRCRPSLSVVGCSDDPARQFCTAAADAPSIFPRRKWPRSA